MAKMTPDIAQRLLLPAISLRHTRIGGYAPSARAGQLMRVGPRCAACGSPRMLVLVADLTEVEGSSHAGITLAVCPYCSLDGDDGSRTTIWAGPVAELPEVTRGIDLRGVLVQTGPGGDSLLELVELPDAKEDPEGYAAAVGAWQEALVAAGSVQRASTQVGGHAAWLKADATPECPDHGAMELFVQLDGADADLDLGEGGRLYVFTCCESGCDHLRTVVQTA
jgi:hypothetical protein